MPMDDLIMVTVLDWIEIAAMSQTLDPLGTFFQQLKARSPRKMWRVVDSLQEKDRSQRPETTSLFRRSRRVIGEKSQGATKNITQWPASKVCLDHSLRRLEQHGSWLVAPPKKISCLVSRREPHWGWSPSLPLEHEDKKWVRHAQELNKISPVGLFISSVMFWVHR